MSSGTDLWFAFTTGILGAVHCLGMCNGVNGGYFAARGQVTRVTDLIAFHGMRITAYTVLGVSGALLGRLVVQSGIVGKAQALFMMLAGIVIVLLGLNMARRAHRSAPVQGGTISVPLRDQCPKQNTFTPPAVAGLANGLVPCSLVALVAIKAAATTDPMQAGLMMLVFGAGTLPTLVAMSLVGGFAGLRSDGTWARLLGLAVVLAGLWTFYQGLVVYDILRGLANW